MNLELIMEIQRKFAINIKSECLYQNITLKDLAKKTGISYTTILSYTKGSGSLPSLVHEIAINNQGDISNGKLQTD